MSAYYRCGHCEEIYKEGDELTATVSGRVGGYENWLPDEHFSYCPHCETDVESAGCEEVTIEEILERVEYYKDLAERLLGTARRGIANIGNKGLAYAYREELNELEKKL